MVPPGWVWSAGYRDRWRDVARAGGGVIRAFGGARLTSREWEVLELLAQGRSTSEIARELVLSNSAVRVHIAALVKKLDVEDRAAAAALFRKRSAI